MARRTRAGCAASPMRLRLPVASSIDFVFGQFADGAWHAEPSSAHDGDAIAEAKELRDVAADHESRTSQCLRLRSVAFSRNQLGDLQARG